MTPKLHHFPLFFVCSPFSSIKLHKMIYVYEMRKAKIRREKREKFHARSSSSYINERCHKRERIYRCWINSLKSSFLLRNHWHETKDVKKYNFMNATMFLMMVFIKKDKKCFEDRNRKRKTFHIVNLKIWLSFCSKIIIWVCLLFVEAHELCRFNYTSTLKELQRRGNLKPHCIDNKNVINEARCITNDKSASNASCTR